MWGSLNLRESSHLPPRGTAFSRAPALQSLGWVRWLRGSLGLRESLPSLSLRDISPPRERLFFICRFCLCLLFPRGTALALVLFECLAYNRHKESTHSIVDASVLVNVPKDIAYSGCRQSRLFYFYLSFFVRKVSNAIIDVLRSNNTFITSKKIEIISKSVICVTSLPVGWEAATPCRGYFLGLF